LVCTVISIILVFVGLCCEDVGVLIAATLFALVSNVDIYIDVKKGSDKNDV